MSRRSASLSGIVTHPQRQHLLSRSAGGQQGVALVVALLLLIVITLVGLAAVRGTIMQQKMSSNLFDRQLAFQSAEAALRAGAALIASNPGNIARNCQAGGTVCQGNPFNDSSTKIISVESGTSAGQFEIADQAFSQPQYVIENMGNWVDTNTSTGYSQSANAHQYGAQGKSSTAIYYRVTARSGDPAKVGDRAVVTLQAMIKQGG